MNISHIKKNLLLLSIVLSKFKYETDYGTTQSCTHIHVLCLYKHTQTSFHDWLSQASQSPKGVVHQIE